MLDYILISYVALSIILGGLQLINRNRICSVLLTGIFILVQFIITGFVMLSTGTQNSDYFGVDSLATLLTIVVTIVSTAAFCHSNRYITQNEQNKDPQVRAQSAGAMTILTMALTMAGLSAHLAVTWIFVEITTLSASALIFYRRTQNSIEATWKYVFACSISLVLVYVGILLASISMGKNAE